MPRHKQSQTDKPPTSGRSTLRVEFEVSSKDVPYVPVDVSHVPVDVSHVPVDVSHVPVERVRILFSVLLIDLFMVFMGCRRVGTLLSSSWVITAE